MGGSGRLATPPRKPADHGHLIATPVPVVSVIGAIPSAHAPLPAVQCHGFYTDGSSKARIQWNVSR